jgi:hypothetical protein
MTICETHRQLYRAIISGGDQDKILFLLLKAFNKVKRMDGEFRKHDREFDRGWYEDNPEYDPTQKTNAIRR